MVMEETYLFICIHKQIYIHKLCIIDMYFNIFIYCYWTGRFRKIIRDTEKSTILWFTPHMGTGPELS